MMAHAILAPPLPVRAAGGGQPSETVSHVALEPFSESVLSHLVSASKNVSSQDGKKFGDEISWLKYMASDQSNAMSAPQRNVLEHPMSSYYISSSHNTYLSGHQLYGEASGEAYTNVLNRGCRCLEIDVWDGENDSETSTSEDDEDRSDAKLSRWDRVKARAARMRSGSRSGAALTAAPAGQPSTSTGLPAPTQSQPETASSDPNYLSPHPSPSLPSKSEPRVLHGYTLTHSVTFRSVCHAIRESAFVSTDLPLIVSLEVHASLAQQEVMVDIMREVWSEHLVCLKKGEEVSVLPPPESLKKKILIKVKWTPNTDTGESNDPLEHVTSNSTDGAGGSVQTSPAKQKKASKVLAALSELGIYTRAYTFKQFSQPEATLPNHVFSLSENKIRSMHSDPGHGPVLFEHNKSFLMRVFPKGTRINSSNVDPTLHWRTGAQMVALNWQRLDKGMMLNEGMFAGTGGWMLKPEGYRRAVASKSGKGEDVKEPKRENLSLEIRLLGAQRIPFPADKDMSYALKMKPYVKAELHIDGSMPVGQGKIPNGQGDPKADVDQYGSEEKDSSVYKRRSATCRTDSPDFAGETMKWPTVPEVIQELSFLRYVVSLLLFLRFRVPFR